jgi:hypothetical protein
VLKRLIIAGALACSCAGAAVPAPIPTASIVQVRESPVVQAKVERRTPAGHVPRPYVIFASMGALMALIAAAVITD